MGDVVPPWSRLSLGGELSLLLPGLGRSGLSNAGAQGDELSPLGRGSSEALERFGRLRWLGLLKLPIVSGFWCCFRTGSGLGTVEPLVSW